MGRGTTGRRAALDCTWEAALVAFERHLVESGRSPHTVDGYASDLAAFAFWYEETDGRGRLHPVDVIADDLRAYQRACRAARLSAATVVRRFAALKTFLGWARQQGWMGKLEPPAFPALARPPRLGPRGLDRNRKNRLVRAVRRSGNPRDLSLILLLLHAGLRVAKVSALVWGDLRLGERKGTVTVRAGKGGKPRRLPLNAVACGALAALRPAAVTADDAVFVGQRGPLTRRGVQELVARHARAAVWRGCRPIPCGTASARAWWAPGWGWRPSPPWPGTKGLETTRRYCSPTYADLERAVERLEDG